MKLQMKQDPLVRAMKSAYRQSKTAQIDRLEKERTRWKRKVTISTRKLARVDCKIAQLAYDFAQLLDKRGDQ